MPAFELDGFFDFMNVFKLINTLLYTHLLIIIIRFGGYRFYGPILLLRLACVAFNHDVISRFSAP